MLNVIYFYWGEFVIKIPNFPETVYFIVLIVKIFCFRDLFGERDAFGRVCDEKKSYGSLGKGS